MGLSFSEGKILDRLIVQLLQVFGYRENAIVNSVGDAVIAGGAKKTVVRFIHYSNPQVGSSNAIVHNHTLINGGETQVIFGQPDTPRTLTFSVQDTGPNLTAGHIHVEGINASNQPVSDDFTLTGGTHVGETLNNYARVDLVTTVGVVGATGSEIINVGTGPKIGLPIDPGGTNIVVFKDAQTNNTDFGNDADQTPIDRSPIGTVNQTYQTIVPFNVPNGQHSYQFWFQFDA